MNNTTIKQRIMQILDQLNPEQLAFVEKVITEITTYLKSEQRVEVSGKTTQNEDDPLAQLRNSDFIGCFEDDPDLAERSEALAQEILSKKKTNQS